jgi:hypothetical protein
MGKQTKMEKAFVIERPTLVEGERNSPFEELNIFLFHCICKHASPRSSLKHFMLIQRLFPT